MLPRRHLRQADNGVFAHTVRCAGRDTDLSCDRREIDDTRAVARFRRFERIRVDAGIHSPQLRAHTIEHALAIDAEHEVEVVVSRAHDAVAVFAVHARDVGGAVQLAAFFDCGGDPGVDGVDVAHVEDRGAVVRA